MALMEERRLPAEVLGDRERAPLRLDASLRAHEIEIAFLVGFA